MPRTYLGMFVVTLAQSFFYLSLHKTARLQGGVRERPLFFGVVYAAIMGRIFRAIRGID